MARDPHDEKSALPEPAAAGIALWPQSISDLTRTDVCPACHRSLQSTLCGFCGLDLTHPASVDLIAISLRAADALTRRLTILRRIRADGAHVSAASAAEPEAAGLLDAPLVFAAQPVSPGQVAPRPDAPAMLDLPAELPAEQLPTRSARFGVSSVQVALLIAGVSLLSAGAVAFLVYAFLNYGIVWRSVIIGTVTIAAFAAATILLRRGLKATAEGIAVFAIVLVFLDAWAVRSNDFFGAATSDPALFWGITVVVASLAFVTWSRWTLVVGPLSEIDPPSVINADRSAGTEVSSQPTIWLRAPHLVGWSALPIGGALLADAAIPTGVGGAPFFAFVAIIAIGLAHPLTVVSRHGIDVPAKAERVVLLSFAALSLVPALAAALIVTKSDAFLLGIGEPLDATPALLAIAAVVVLAGLHVLAARAGPPAAATWSAIFAAVAGPALAASAFALLLADAEAVPTIAGLAVAGVTVAVVVERTKRPATEGSTTGTSTTATSSTIISATAVAALAAIVPLAVAAERLTVTLGAALGNSLRSDTTMVLVAPTRDSMWSIAALALIVAIAAAVWSTRPGRMAAGRFALILWSTAIVAILAVPLLSTAAGVVAGWLALAVTSLGVLIRNRFHRRADLVPATPRRSAPRAVFATLGLTALSFAWLAGWATTTTWAVSTLATIVLLVAARSTISVSTTASATATATTTATTQTARAALLAAAAVVLIIGSATLPSVVALVTPTTYFNGVLGDSARLVAALSAALIAASAIVTPAARATLLDRRAVFWIALTSSLIAWTTLQSGITATYSGGSVAARGVTLATAVLLLAGLLLWVISRTTIGMRIERMAASVAAAPAVYLVVEAGAVLTGITETTSAAPPAVPAAVIPLTAAFLTATASTITVMLGRQPTTRVLREVGIGVVALPAVLSAILSESPGLWLVLLLGALTLLMLAISPDGLVRSASHRRHLGWIALAGGTAALWVRLGDGGVGAVEAFVLPVAGVLLVIAAAIHRINRETPPARAAATVTLAALLVAVLPIAVASIDGPPARALIVGGVSAALLLVGSFVRPRVDAGTPHTATGPVAAARSESRGEADVRPSDRLLLDATAIAGALGVIVTGVGHAASLGYAGNTDLEFDGWLGSMLVILIAAGFGIAGHTRPRVENTRDTRMIISQVVAIAALSAATALEAGAILNDPPIPLRAELTLLALCLIHVLAWFIGTAPLTHAVAWVALALAGLIALVSIASGAVDPLEVATIPLALSLLATGTSRMLDDPGARSWSWLGLPTALLLVPSLLATIGDRPVWRLVGLGVIGVAVLIIGLVRRLQAPFVIAAVVVTIHALATFSPQIRAVYESVEWWIWLIPGGVIVIVLAARLEKRVADLREVARSISSLR